MGLDPMLLVMQIEEHFSVTIPDERAERITTVAELYNFLSGQTRRGRPMPCPTSRAFYALRRTFTGEFGVDRKRVRPAARLRDLFPAAKRAAAWPRLAASLGMPDLPDADPPRRLPRLKTRGFGLTIATAIASLIIPVGILFPDPTFPLVVMWLFTWAGLVVIVCEFWGLLWVGRFLERRTLPRVRDLVVRLAVRSGREGAPPDPGDPLWAELTTLLARHTGMPAAEIRPEHDFDELVR
jgi:hypothetical protein